LRRYLLPGALLFASGGFALARFHGFWQLTEWPVAAVVTAYVVGSAWWIVVAARSRRRLWLNLLAAWVPAGIPLIPLLRALDASNRDDSAGLAVLAHAGPAALALLASAAGAFVIFLRILEPKALPSGADTTD